MNLTLVLSKFESHGVTVFEEKSDENGYKTIVLGCQLPRVDYGGRFVYATLVLSPGQTEVCLEEREALKRRLCHLTTDIFGDDGEDGFLGNDPEAEPGSHVQQIVARG